MIHSSLFFFFNDTATTEIYTLSLHDALPISDRARVDVPARIQIPVRPPPQRDQRSEEHTSELQSQSNLVCRLLLEKKKKQLSKIDCTLRVVILNQPQVLITLRRPLSRQDDAL